MFQSPSILLVLLILWSAGCTQASAADGNNPAAADIRFETRVSAIGNLFYQLECLGHRLRCSHAAYLDLWERIGRYDKADAAAVRRFAQALEVYSAWVQLGSRPYAGEAAYNLFGAEIVDTGPSPLESFPLLNRIRMAAYAAQTREELVQRLSLFMHPQDVAVLTSTMDRFWPAFDSWWKTEASAAVQAFATELAAVLKEQNRTTLPAIVAFYGLKPPEQGISLMLHLVAHPEKRAATNAEVVDNQAVVEVLAGEAPTDRLGVIVHELAHYLFKIAPREIHERRLEVAVRADSSRSAAVLGLMNESLATAIGNGYVEAQLLGDGFDQYRSRELSFYGQAEIDVAAKTIYPLVKEYLDNDRMLDEAFVEAYYARVERALGAALDSVSARLRVSAYIATDETLAEAMRRVPRELGMTSLYGSTLSRGESIVDSMLYRHDYLNGVVLLRESERPMAGQLLPGAFGRVDRIESGDAQSCALQRPSGAVVYFAVFSSAFVDASAIVSQLETTEPCE